MLRCCGEGIKDGVFFPWGATAFPPVLALTVAPWSPSAANSRLAKGWKTHSSSPKSFSQFDAETPHPSPPWEDPKAAMGAQTPDPPVFPEQPRAPAHPLTHTCICSKKAASQEIKNRETKEEGLCATGVNTKPNADEFLGAGDGSGSAAPTTVGQEVTPRVALRRADGSSQTRPADPHFKDCLHLCSWWQLTLPGFPKQGRVGVNLFIYLFIYLL